MKVFRRKYRFRLAQSSDCQQYTYDSGRKADLKTKGVAKDVPLGVTQQSHPGVMVSTPTPGAARPELASPGGSPWTGHHCREPYRVGRPHVRAGMPPLAGRR